MAIRSKRHTKPHLIDERERLLERWRSGRVMESELLIPDQENPLGEPTRQIRPVAKNSQGVMQVPHLWAEGGSPVKIQLSEGKKDSQEYSRESH